ncbi:DUF2637 domain-containing protein [Actinomadura rupiterrae]|uniref:DUF2637 domain-containing protein n=1 Tax=Actinomadura rupiterrae TaxID=559627 RepID=UPI0020A50328|nr:DUF2637 domain-containing protein [Actinomadura rupiterrae]MCP2339141.1 hypothetical protein [Actinomadura rupiterrae]
MRNLNPVSAVRRRLARRIRQGSPAPAARQQQSSGYVRLGGGLSLAALAAITAVISYQHGLDVTHRTGSHGWVAYLVPLVADLMIFGSSLALLDAAQHGMRRPRLAVTSLAFGILSTVAMNVASGWHVGRGSALVSALAPVALVLSYETLMGMVRRAREGGPAPADDGSSEPVARCPHGVASTGEDAALTAFLHQRDCSEERPSIRQVAQAFAVNRNRLSEMVREHGERGAQEPDGEPGVPPEINGRVPVMAGRDAS